jgi:hypothetical protein
MGRRAHRPDRCGRHQVEALAVYGAPEPRVVGIEPKTGGWREPSQTGELR